MNIIDFALSKARVFVGILIFIIVSGAATYITIPKESTPDVNIPIIYVSLSQTGISAEDRARTIQVALKQGTRPVDLRRPGHIFPLKAKSGGVLRRSGHTEAAIDFARLAGFKSAGVIVEIMNDDGTMSRLPQLFKVAEKIPSPATTSPPEEPLSYIVARNQVPLPLLVSAR